MSKKRKNLHIETLLFWWLLLTTLILISGGLGGALAGNWTTPGLFFFALLEVFKGAVAPWAIGTILAVSLMTVLFTIKWISVQFFKKRLEKTVALPVNNNLTENLEPQFFESAKKQVSGMPTNHKTGLVPENTILEKTPPDNFSLSQNTPSPESSPYRASKTNVIPSQSPQTSHKSETPLQDDSNTPTSGAQQPDAESFDEQTKNIAKKLNFTPSPIPSTAAPNADQTGSPLQQMNNSSAKSLQDSSNIPTLSPKRLGEQDNTSRKLNFTSSPISQKAEQNPYVSPITNTPARYQYNSDDKENTVEIIKTPPDKFSLTSDNSQSPINFSLSPAISPTKREGL